MALQTLYLHWKTARLGLIPLVIAAFGLPLMAVKGTDPTAGQISQAYQLLGANGLWLPAFPALAAAVGGLLALSAWTWDHRGEHVYALSLPISRRDYALLKFGAGVVLALIPTVALYAGSLAAVAALDLPAGLNAYPAELTGRFLFTAVLFYSVLFALASGTIRTAVIVISLLIASPILLSLASEFLAVMNPMAEPVDLADRVLAAIADFGPVRIISGNWMLIDV